jgi:hypothetical protein
VEYRPNTNISNLICKKKIYIYIYKEPVSNSETGRGDQGRRRRRRKERWGMIRLYELL